MGSQNYNGSEQTNDEGIKMFELDDLSVGLTSSQTEPSTTIDYDEVNDDEDNDDDDNDDEDDDDEDDDDDDMITSYQDPSIGYYNNHHRRFFDHIHQQQQQQQRVVYLLGQAHVVNHHPTSTTAVSSSSSSASSAAMSNAIIELVQNYQQSLYWFTYRSELIVPLRPYNSPLHAPHSFAWNASHAVYSSPFASNATTNINDDDAIAAVPIETNDNNLGGTGGMKTDAGWGCMLRSAQMLLAETVRRHYSSSESDYNDNDDDDDNNNNKEKDEKKKKKKKKNSKSSRMEEERIARWFADFPNHTPNHSSTFAATTAANEGNECIDDISDCGGIDNHWYSLHSMVAAGLGLGMLPGEWYGPNMVCHVLSELNAIHCASREELLLLLSQQKKMNNNVNDNNNVNNNETVNEDNTTTSTSLLHSCDVFRIHVANGGTVYVDAITKLMTSSSTTFQRQQQQSQGGDDGIGQVSDEKCEPPLPIDEFDDPLRSTTIPQNKFIDEDDNEYDDGGIEWDTSLLLLLPLRLGINSISTSDYGSTLSKLMSFPHSVGMLGGTPRHALWFYGADAIDGGNNDHQDYDGGWYGLDPHIVQLAPRGVRVSNAGTTRTSSAAAPTWEDVCNDMESVEETQPPTTTTTTTIPTTATSIPTYRWQVQLTNSYLTSLHTSPTGVTHSNHKRAIPLSKLDPSCALGFYIRNRDDFIHLCQLIRKLGTDELQRQNKLLDVITVMTRTPRYELDDCSAGVLNDSVDCGLDGFAMSSDDVECEEENDNDDDDDDFVLI